MTPPHPFERNARGICKTMIGGRKTGYRLCHEPEDAPIHRMPEPEPIPPPPADWRMFE